MKSKLKVGDIFYLETEEHHRYVFGKILFDVDKQYHKVVDTAQFSSDYFPYLLMSHDGCQLVEMYEGIYDNIIDFKKDKAIITRVFTKKIDTKNNILNWGLVQQEDVDYTKIEFPEQLNRSNNHIYLDRGEISIKTNISIDEGDKLGFKTKIYVPPTIADACLHFQNRRDLIPEDVRWPIYLENNDLLYNQELRNKIYTDLNIDPDKSYYELSKEMGFDLARFYEK